MQTTYAQRSILMDRFPDGSGYLFNAENPSGVKYLPKAAFDNFVDLVSLYGNPPLLPSTSSGNTFVEQIVSHGLSKNVARTLATKQKPKALTIWFHVSNACNLSCRYCYIPKLQKATTPSKAAGFFMPSETAELATQRLFDFCQSDGFTHLQIKFAGGEPTLNPDLMQEVCILASALSEITGIKVGFRILTNGIFPDEQLLTIFKRFKFGVSISLDGNKESHDKIRYIASKRYSDTLPAKRVVREGTWDDVLINIDKLLDIGIKPYILCTVTKDNYTSLRELIELCISKKIGFRLSPIRDKTSHTVVGLQDSILEELKSIYTWIGDTLPVSMPLERFARFAEWNLTVRKQIVCGSCRSTMSVDHLGNVASCQMRMDKPFGNLKSASVKDIFDKIKASEFNTFIVSPENKTRECASCYWRYTCAGGCPEHTRNALGTINSPSPWCDLYMNLLPVYVRAIANQIKRAIEENATSSESRSDAECVEH
ncbi:radical SAM protein [Nevskia sp.]|uniref:radical SAM/SPASM domain-containing protein n=1 Tax=Nevskia sp. TaxID=1929292 RepID=UPI0025E3A7DE|nr:radical SAM protein [Nevskia sp.]